MPKLPAQLEFTSDFLEDSRFLMMSEEKFQYLYNFLGLQDFHNILDIGCGTGYFTRQMAKYLGINSHVCGLDINRNLINAANNFANSMGQKINFLCGNATRLPFPCKAFDLTITHFLLSRLVEDDARKTLKEMYRVTKENGVIATFEPCLGGTTALFTEDERLSDLLRRIRLAKSSIEFELYGINENIGAYVPEFLDTLGAKAIEAEIIGIPSWSPPPFPITQISPEVREWYIRRLSQLARPKDSDVIKKFGELKDASSALRILSDAEIDPQLAMLYQSRGITVNDLIDFQQARVNYITSIINGTVSGWVKSFEMIPIFIVKSKRA